MANQNAPRGLVPVAHANGSGLTTPRQYKILTNDTTSAIYLNDPVKLGSSGTAGYVIRGTAGAAILGVFAGCEYTVTATGERVKQRYYDGVTGKSDIVCWVYDDPEQVYEIQATGALTQANVGTAYDFVIAAGSTSTGVTATYLNSSGDGFTVLGLSPRVGNEFGAYNKVLVKAADSDHLLA